MKAWLGRQNGRKRLLLSIWHRMHRDVERLGWNCQALTLEEIDSVLKKLEGEGRDIEGCEEKELALVPIDPRMAPTVDNCVLIEAWRKRFMLWRFVRKVEDGEMAVGARDWTSMLVRCGVLAEPPGGAAQWQQILADAGIKE